MRPELFSLEFSLRCRRSLPLKAVADDLPKDFYIAMNGHDYLLPTRATIAVLRHKHEGVLNEIQFRDYRRFGAKAPMVPMDQQGRDQQ